MTATAGRTAFDRSRDGSKDVPTPGERAVTRTLPVPPRQVYRALFCLLILSSTYDKSGIVLTLSGRPVSVSFYKILFALLLVPLVADQSVKFGRRFRDFDPGVYRSILGFVVIQTVASVMGSLTTPGAFPLSAEVYHFVQRSSLLFIPLFAFRVRLSPGFVTRLFLVAVILHFVSLGVQFASPAGYIAVLRHVEDVTPAQGLEDVDNSAGARPDNAFIWDQQTLAFIGLQRTANYGIFVAAFGLLTLVVAPKTLPRKLFRFGGSGAAILIALFGGSRAVFIMMCVALLAITIKLRSTGTGAAAVARLISAAVIATLLLTFVFVASDSGLLSGQMFSSIGAFTDPDKEGSNAGKAAIFDYGMRLFRQAPLVGHGARKFSDISAAVGNASRSTSETHSYVLATLLSSGLVGLGAYCVMLLSVTAALLRKKDSDGPPLLGLFIGLSVYNVIYDAGGLDVFACFGGVATYYALTRSPEARGNAWTGRAKVPLRTPVAASGLNR